MFATLVLLALFVHIVIQIIHNYSDETILLIFFNTLFAGLFIMFCKFFAGYFSSRNKGFESKLILKSVPDLNSN